VSTSGFAWKYPGRVGDSPIAGAGYYADNRYGAAGCTGTGELAIRAATSRCAVLYLQMGYDLEDAGRAAMSDLVSLDHGTWSGMSLLMLDPQGRAMGFSNIPRDKQFLVMTPEMEEPEERPRIIVPGGVLPPG
jgi:beta-aspartyl-peptidase (threonine type)